MKIRLLILSLLVSVPAFAWQPQTGDIIFQISRSSQSKAIQLATHSDYSHTGMLVIRNKKPYVFEAVGPVKYTPLKQWIAHGEKGKYVVRRVEGGLSVEQQQKLAQTAKRYLGKPYDFSFSGLKTAVINLIHNARQKGEEIDVNSLAACFQYTVADILTQKFIAAAKEGGYKTLALAGGVAANSGLRSMLQQRADYNRMKVYYPPLALCGDNAAMIGCQAYYEYKAGHIAGSDLNAVATMRLDRVTW